jgi:hypothetical protein
VLAPLSLGSVEEVPLTRLSLWSENPRRIRPERLADLRQALVADPEMLWAKPLLALPDGTVIWGNMRLLAARELGWSTLPVLTVDLNPERARLWALRDNQAYGEWDEPALAELLAELAGQGVDLALTGCLGLPLAMKLFGKEIPLGHLVGELPASDVKIASAVPLEGAHPPRWLVRLEPGERAPTRLPLPTRITQLRHVVARRTAPTGGEGGLSDRTTPLSNARAQRAPRFVRDLTPFFGPPVMRVGGRGQHAIGGRMLPGFGS